MTIFRKKKDSDTWHWCTNCTEYPKSDFIEKEFTNSPSPGEKCNQCIAKEKAGKCDKIK